MRVSRASCPPGPGVGVAVVVGVGVIQLKQAVGVDDTVAVVTVAVGVPGVGVGVRGPGDAVTVAVGDGVGQSPNGTPLAFQYQHHRIASSFVKRKPIVTDSPGSMQRVSHLKMTLFPPAVPPVGWGQPGAFDMRVTSVVGRVHTISSSSTHRDNPLVKVITLSPVGVAVGVCVGVGVAVGVPPVHAPAVAVAVGVQPGHRVCVGVGVEGVAVGVCVGVPVQPGQRVWVGVGVMGSVAKEGAGVAVAVAVAVGVGVIEPGDAQISLWKPSLSARSPMFIVVIPEPLKTTTWLPGAFGLLSSRSIIIWPVLHSFPTTWRFSCETTPPLGALYELSSGTGLAGVSGERAKSSVPL